MKKKNKKNILPMTSSIYRVVEEEISKIDDRNIKIAYIAQEIDKRLYILTTIPYYEQCDKNFLQAIMKRYSKLTPLNDLFDTLQNLTHYNKLTRLYVCNLIDFLISTYDKNMFRYYYTLDKMAYSIDYINTISNQKLDTDKILPILQFLEYDNKALLRQDLLKDKTFITKYLHNIIHITEPKPYSHIHNKNGVTHVKLDLSRPLKEIIDIVTALKEEYDKNPSKFQTATQKLYGNDIILDYQFISGDTIKEIFYNKREKNVDIISKLIGFFYIFDHLIIKTKNQTELFEDIYLYFVGKNLEVTPITAQKFVQAVKKEIEEKIDIKQLQELFE